MVKRDSGRPPAARSAKPATPTDGKRRARLIVIWSSVVVVALLAITGSLLYTEQSSFCPVCHEMQPYYDAWQAGGHVSHAECVDCHIDPGFVAHIAHKPSEMVELWDHFFGNKKFPNFNVDVPNSRCVRCHATVNVKSASLFSHATHAAKATCKDCHSQAGHIVSIEALASAGILKTDVTVPSVTGVTPSAITGHKKVVCQECHNQAQMKCSQCHQPPHEDRGECSNCHRPGTAFVASHPSGTDCASCHKPPANHFGTDCKSCHTPGTPFTSATFNHPRTQHGYQSRPCVKCHPNGYATAYCTCHNGHPPTD